MCVNLRDKEKLVEYEKNERRQGKKEQQEDRRQGSEEGERAGPTYPKT